MGLAFALGAAPGFAGEAPPGSPAKADGQASGAEPGGGGPQPCLTGPSTNKEPGTDSDKIPRFVKDSPFDGTETPALKKERRLWADSWLWDKAPDLVVEKWLTDKPDTKGKYVLIEFWAPWCGPCRRSIALLNGFHQKYGKELVVIGISEENEEVTGRLNAEHPEIPQIEFFSAVDTKKRLKDALGVWGIPHVIVLEPDHGCVIWEGFPLQEGYELTDEIIEKFLEVGRRLRTDKAADTAE